MFANQVYLQSRNITKFSTRLENFCRGVNISHPHVQQISMVRIGNLLTNQELHLGTGCRLMLESKSGSTVSSIPKTNPMEIYLDTCDLPPPRNPETLKTPLSHRPDCYSERFAKPRKRIKVDLTLNPHESVAPISRLTMKTRNSASPAELGKLNLLHVSMPNDHALLRDPVSDR
ncbi:hypothetical protein ACTXT7_011855 [Hymenolepis weldensis]